MPSLLVPSSLLLEFPKVCATYRSCQISTWWDGCWSLLAAFSDCSVWVPLAAASVWSSRFSANYVGNPRIGSVQVSTRSSPAWSWWNWCTLQSARGGALDTSTLLPWHLDMSQEWRTNFLITSSFLWWYFATCIVCNGTCLLDPSSAFSILCLLIWLRFGLGGIPTWFVGPCDVMWWDVGRCDVMWWDVVVVSLRNSEIFQLQTSFDHFRRQVCSMFLQKSHALYNLVAQASMGWISRLIMYQHHDSLP